MASRLFSKGMRDQIWDRDEGFCVYCGERAQEVDHVVPYRLGGPSTRSNGVLACVKCNHQKSGRLDEEMIWKAFTHLLKRGESLAWVDSFWPRDR